jgi:DNA-binding NarL/FixJ family response regulator
LGQNNTHGTAFDKTAKETYVFSQRCCFLPFLSHSFLQKIFTEFYEHPIVDYSAPFADDLASLLTDEGFTCKTAYSLRSGWEYLRTHVEELSVVFVEVALNHHTLSGLDFLEEAKRMYPPLAVVVITAIDHAFVAREAARLGADALLLKQRLTRVQLLLTIMSATDMMAERKAALADQPPPPHEHQRYLPPMTVLLPEPSSSFLAKLYGHLPEWR